MKLTKALTSKKTTYIVLAVGVVFTAVGIASGESKIVLGKAIKICLECIGIG